MDILKMRRNLIYFQVRRIIVFLGIFIVNFSYSQSISYSENIFTTSKIRDHCVSDDGSIWMAGTMVDNYGYQYHRPYMAKLDKDGNILFRKNQLSSNHDFTGELRKILPYNNEIYCLAYFRECDLLGTDFTLLKYDSSGRLLYENTITQVDDLKLIKMYCIRSKMESSMSGSRMCGLI